MLNQRGQSLLEYGLMLAFIIVGVLFMGIYIQRAVSGRIKQSAEDIDGRYEYGKIISNQIMNISRSIDYNVVFVGRDDEKKVKSNIIIERDDATQIKNEVIW